MKRALRRTAAGAVDIACWFFLVSAAILMTLAARLENGPQ